MTANEVVPQDLEQYFGIKPSKEQKIKRPMNAFMVWAKIKRKSLSQENPKMHNADLSKMLGKLWKTLPENEKFKFQCEAKALKLLHKEKYPDYKYKPKRKKLPKMKFNMNYDRQRPEYRYPQCTMVMSEGNGIIHSSYPLLNTSSPFSTNGCSTNLCNDIGNASTNYSASVQSINEMQSLNLGYENYNAMSMPCYSQSDNIGNSCNVVGCSEFQQCALPDIESSFGPMLSYNTFELPGQNMF